MKQLLDLATVFRAAYFAAHEAHHMTKGATFLQDHAFYSDLYTAYLEAFDTLIERALGLDERVDEQAVNAAALKRRGEAPAGINYRALLAFEREIQSLIASMDDLSPGSENLVQGLADESEARAYKLQQLSQ